MTGRGGRGGGFAAAIWVLLAVVVALLSVFPVSSYDTWWHLKAGEYMLEHRTVPVTDIFSYTAQGSRWVSHEWLFEVVAYLVHSTGGITGLILFKAAIVLLTFAAQFELFRRLGVDAVVAAPIVVTQALLVTMQSFDRPHVVTQLFVSVFVMALFTFRSMPGKGAARRLFLLLLPAQLIWANSHAGMVAGFIIVGLFLAGEIAHSIAAPYLGWLAQDRLAPRALGALALLLALLVGVSLINPNFSDLLHYVFLIAGDPLYMATIVEWRQTTRFPVLSADAFVAFWLMLGLGAASFALRRRDVHISHLVLFAATGYAGVTAVRNLALFALVGGPIIALNVQAALDRRRATKARVPRSRAPAVAVCAALLACVVVICTRGTLVNGELRRPGFGIKERIFPIRAAEFLEQNPVEGNILNSMEFGGYLIWRWYPHRRVFIDGRLDVYGPERFTLYSNLLTSRISPGIVARDYDVSCFLLMHPLRSAAATPYHVARTLVRTPGWQLVYWDDQALIYVKDIPAHRTIIERHAYRAVGPLVLGFEPAPGVRPDAMVEEARRASTLNPGPRTLSVLGETYLHARDQERAAAAFAQALAIDPRYAPALGGLQRAREQARRHRPDPEAPAVSVR